MSIKQTPYSKMSVHTSHNTLINILKKKQKTRTLHWEIMHLLTFSTYTNICLSKMTKGTALH